MTVYFENRRTGRIAERDDTDPLVAKMDRSTKWQRIDKPPKPKKTTRSRRAASDDQPPVEPDADGHEGGHDG